MSLQPVRLNRSQLSVPASSARYLEKATESQADIVMLDLEDSISAEGKINARQMLIEALNELDWSAKTVSVRVNAMGSPWFEDDMDALFSKASDFFELLMVPKVETVAQVSTLHEKLRLLDNSKMTGLELQIESPLAVVNVNAIAAAGSAGRVEALHFGPGDYAASLGVPNLSIGADGSGGDLDHRHYALSAIANAARAFGLRPIDGPLGDFKDENALFRSAMGAHCLGFEGKWAIHPSQVDTLNEIFSPDPAMVEEARQIIGALEDAKSDGKAAVSLEGRMVDLASIRQARHLLEKASLILDKKIA